MSSYTLPFRFVYQNTKGVTTKRELISLTEDDDYISGLQRLDGGMRTFSKSRILEVLHTDSDWDNCPYPEPEARFDNRKQSTAQAEIKPEIAFTGFSASKRAELESLATESGMMVRKNVTKNLGYLCIGPNAGPLKIQKASDAGVVIMDEDEFIWFIDTGEMPGIHLSLSNAEVDTNPNHIHKNAMADFKEETPVPSDLPDPQTSQQNKSVTKVERSPVREVNVEQLLNKKNFVKNAETNNNKKTAFTPTSANDFISVTLPAGLDDSIEYVTITKTEYDDLLSIKESYKGLKESTKPTRWKKIKNIFAWIGILFSTIIFLAIFIGEKTPS